MFGQDEDAQQEITLDAEDLATDDGGGLNWEIVVLGLGLGGAGIWALTEEVHAEPPGDGGDQNQPPTAQIAVVSQSGLTVELSGGASTDPDGSIESYNWNVGGTGYSGANVTHTFQSGGTYTITLEVTDDQGATDLASTTVTVAEQNEAPTADISVVSKTDLTVDLSAAGSSDPDGTIVGYNWNVGGTTYTGPNVTHTFESGGTYTVTLEVTDDQGATDMASTSVTVTAPNQAPTADITVVSQSGLTVDLTGSGSTDPDGSIVGYNWNVGGTTYTGVDVTHTFDSGGTYTITLEVVDDDGATDMTSTTVTVSEQTGDQGYGIGGFGMGGYGIGEEVTTARATATAQRAATQRRFVHSRR